MIALYLILTIAIIYAIVRARHDSYLSHGAEWKLWAFVEGIVIAISVSVLATFAAGLMWWIAIPLTVVFALSFWVVFDCYQGWIRTGNILHIGTQGFDAKMRAMFKYKKGYAYLFVKLFWLLLAVLASRSFIIN